MFLWFLLHVSSVSSELYTVWVAMYHYCKLLLLTDNCLFIVFEESLQCIWLRFWVWTRQWTRKEESKAKWSSIHRTSGCRKQAIQIFVRRWEVKRWIPLYETPLRQHKCCILWHIRWLTRFLATAHKLLVLYPFFYRQQTRLVGIFFYKLWKMNFLHQREL